MLKRVLTVATAILLAAPLDAAAETGSARPNILLVLLDDVGFMFETGSRKDYSAGRAPACAELRNRKRQYEAQELRPFVTIKELYISRYAPNVAAS